ncbi:MAG: ROK family protein [Paenibacillus sp.]|nr:ROK family protein [Paenibacillus sp.]
MRTGNAGDIGHIVINSNRGICNCGQSGCFAEMEKLVARVLGYIGTGCVTLINTFDPELLIIGGGVSQVGAPLFEAVSDYK